jgi:hypothetical protein
MKDATLEQLIALRTNFVRAQTLFTDVISELEEELKRMKKSDKVPQEFIDQKDAQIDNLVRYNNTVEDVFNWYKLMTISLKMELAMMDKMLWQVVHNNKEAFEETMKNITKVPNL